MMVRLLSFCSVKSDSYRPSSIRISLHSIRIKLIRLMGSGPRLAGSGLRFAGSGLLGVQVGDEFAFQSDNDVLEKQLALFHSS